MAEWIKDNARYYFDIIDNEACLYKIEFSKDKPRKIELPSEVQYNGKTYPVTQLKGWKYVSPKQEQVTDKRRKDYGTWVNIPGEYYRFDAPLLHSSYFYDDRVEEVILPKTVRVIGYATFHGCRKLKNIKLNNGLESIGASAFVGCEALKEITIPSSVKKIGRGCFDGGVSVSIKIQNKPGAVEFEAFAVGADDNVTYVGKSLLSRIFK